MWLRWWLYMHSKNKWKTANRGVNVSEWENAIKYSMKVTWVYYFLGPLWLEEKINWSRNYWYENTVGLKDSFCGLILIIQANLVCGRGSAENQMLLTHPVLGSKLIKRCLLLKFKWEDGMQKRVMMILNIPVKKKCKVFDHPGHHLKMNLSSLLTVASSQ